MSSNQSVVAATFATLIALLGTSVGAVEEAKKEAKKEVAGRTLEQWAADLDSDNEIVRLRATKSLGPFGGAATDTLIKALDDKSAGVQYWAAYHLGPIGPKAKAAVGKLKAIKADTGNVKHPGAALAAAYALCRIEGVKPHIDLLIERTSHTERSMACSAAEFLGMIGPDAKAAVPILEKHQKGHKDYHVKGACQNALRKIVMGWGK